MFGSKLRAWMEAVRPKKKQHRRDKQGKTTVQNSRPNVNTHTVTWKNTCLLDSEKKDVECENNYGNSQGEKDGVTNTQLSRYSTTNLSSPESAYSTGYSTDGTSPGAPPDYLLNGTNRTSVEHRLNTPNTSAHIPPSSRTAKHFSKPVQNPPNPSVASPVPSKAKEYLEEKDKGNHTAFFGKIEDTSGLVSPRQRNRIRTNPWLPGGTSSAAPSPLPTRQEKKTPVALRSYRNSPIQNRYLSPVAHRRSLSSSSCSSLSAGNHTFDHRVPRSLSDEDDCTLNEMMGKYDESYVYEKETDILSDSDPTDCESDIDTGQDGGDEDENADAELDFIDNGSYIELNCKTDNTGHCSYFIPQDSQRRKSSRKRTSRRAKEPSERNRKSNTSKKNHRQSSEKNKYSFHRDGSKSAGATPLSVRRSSLKPRNYELQEACLKKRSNSVSFNRDPTVLIDKRDREADIKYRELIGQAEQIIRTMNINGLSPRRIPGPTNKRVELLRYTECSKPETPLLPNCNAPPSNNLLKNTRFSPKKNHITNFMINNSPVLVRKELQGQSPLGVRKGLNDEVNHSPLVSRKYDESLKKVSVEKQEVSHSFLVNSSFKPKSILHKSEYAHIGVLSPRHRKAVELTLASSSSDEETFHKSKKKLSKSCPQSEPMKRKKYCERTTFNVAKGHGKTVAFNLNNGMPNLSLENSLGSSENLRHQVLLNTIQNLKRNLEDHSASLQQTYKGTHHKYKY
ncbi:uncharacterized protein LOC115875049 [Sitophilus oryzae]|uniref:Uncharacterized protein LOC115875049 n=1 Tax=Sitophilus oryzae TaxID=7048 RepID=A0A6J2X514_SITOR|nr:uncharacterized protein LOC115875049 [Sitophilus oryzae]